MADQTRIKTSLYMQDSDHRRVKALALDLRIKENDFMEMAVKSAIEMASRGTPLKHDDPAELTEHDQAAADALLAWWKSPEQDQVQEHLKRAIAAMLQIEHLLPASLKAKKPPFVRESMKGR
jgi:hypothetical protein